MIDRYARPTYFVAATQSGTICGNKAKGFESIDWAEKDSMWRVDGGGRGPRRRDDVERAKEMTAH